MKNLGYFGEGIAEQYFSERGYKIVARNYYTRYGEIDLVCENEGRMIFVEVKTRTSDAYGKPEASLSYRKQQRLVKAALRYLKSFDVAWQIDVLAITLHEDDADIVHFPNCIANES